MRITRGEVRERELPARRGADLAAFGCATAYSYHHPSGTCKMGPASDPMAVVDAAGRVHGLDGVYVADASIMPSLPAGMPNLACMAIGERLAELFDAAPAPREPLSASE